MGHTERVIQVMNKVLGFIAMDWAIIQLLCQMHVITPITVHISIKCQIKGVKQTLKTLH